MLNGPNRPPGPPQQQQFPPWLENTLRRVVKVWLVGNLLPTEGYFSSAAGGFMEIVEREPDPAKDSFGKWQYVASYFQIGHVCRIAPLDAQSQWTPVPAHAGLAVAEKPKLVI